MPKSVPFILDAIPLELRELPRWACWQERPNPKGGKPGKPPINPNIPFAGTHVYARCNNECTWASFDAGLRYWRDHLRGEGPASGLSFALNGDGIIGIDLDNCRNVQSMTIDDWALAIIKRFGSYSEIRGHRGPAFASSSRANCRLTDGTTDQSKSTTATSS